MLISCRVVSGGGAVALGRGCGFNLPEHPAPSALVEFHSL